MLGRGKREIELGVVQQGYRHEKDKAKLRSGGPTAPSMVICGKIGTSDPADKGKHMNDSDVFGVGSTLSKGRVST